MAIIYVARSPTVQEWAADVGLTEHVYKVGIAKGTAEAAVEALNGESFAGTSDWTLLSQRPLEGADPAAVAERLGRKEKAVDPLFYPRIKGATGLYKVKIANVQTRLLMQKMMAGEEEKVPKKPKVADIADYLLGTATE
jgi:hypothetical protein